MRIKQYVSFALSSDHVSGHAMAKRIGLMADRTTVRGSKIAGPRPIPRCHSWAIVCDTAGLTVDEQIERVLDRVRARQEAIRECVTTDGCSATLHVVRYLGARLDDDEGEEEDITVTDDGMEKLPGQHQLLGWHLRTDALAFLLHVGAEIDVDEYG
jgi:Domain of unknown function (DUF4279)